MSRVRRKKSLKNTFTDSKKTDQNFCFFLKPRQIGGVEQLSSTRAEQLLKPRHMLAVERAIKL